ncbi:phosphopantetheine-binding protein [Streptomyces specialis]|uniref:phosphopantetheine-binding protein n=1 Tax=Streptomyces specialis TaxID=498367 RepID=UPI00073EF194|nr:phosphopantetheine-binding protein [Streptomyces specialis]
MRHEDIFAAVRRNVGEVMDDVDPAAVTLDRSLADLGCNSIDRAEVVTLTMADLGITVPVMDFQDARDLRALVALLARHAA